MELALEPLVHQPNPWAQTQWPSVLEPKPAIAVPLPWAPMPCHREPMRRPLVFQLRHRERTRLPWEPMLSPVVRMLWLLELGLLPIKRIRLWSAPPRKPVV